MKWRLTFDVPYSFVTAPGYLRAVHCGDFRPDEKAFDKTWREPACGLVMLKPRFLNDDHTTDQVELSLLRHAIDGWRAVNRAGGLTGAAMFTNTKTDGHGGFPLIEILVDLAIQAVAGALMATDTLKWALESSFNLEPDEGFSIGFHTSHDEMHRYDNWMYVQWDNIGIHISNQGRLRVWRYTDRADMNNAAKRELVEEFEFAAAQDLNNRWGSLMFVPAPPWGLLVYYASQKAMTNLVTRANVSSAISNGHLIPWEATETGADPKAYKLFDASPVRIAMNPNIHYTMGLHRIRYPEPGTYTTEIFDPGFEPNTDPVLAGLPLQSGHGTITEELMKVDLSGAWDKTADQQARLRLSLSTDDPVYTPFLAGYGVEWDPEVSERNTAPFVPRLVPSIEWTDDEKGRWEGKAEVVMEGDDGLRISERGDATFLLECSADGVTWSVVAGGLATDWDLDAQIDASGFYYTGSCALHDLWYRMGEVRYAMSTAFNDMAVGDAINRVLAASGFTPMAEETIPQVAKDRRLPPAPPGGQGWTLAPRMGDTGDRICEKLLIFLRRQWEEWIMVYDWTGRAWTLSTRPRDESPEQTWTLTPYSNGHNPAARIVRYARFKPTPHPPEGNLLQVAGVSSTDQKSAQLVLSPPLVNLASINDPTSPDYLGRVKTAWYLLPECLDQKEVNLAARAAFDAGAHRALEGTAELQEYTPTLAPNLHLHLLDHLGRVRLDGWVKRRSVKIVPGFPSGFDETMTLDLNTMWEGEIRRG